MQQLSAMPGDPGEAMKQQLLLKKPGADGGLNLLGNAAAAASRHVNEWQRGSAQGQPSSLAALQKPPELMIPGQGITRSTKESSSNAFAVAGPKRSMALESYILNPILNP